MDKFNVMVSPVNVLTTKTLQETYNSLYYWPFPYCEVFAVETPEEAAVLARQIYNARFLIRTEFVGQNPMSLPNACPIALMDTRAPMAEAMLPSPMMLPGMQIGTSQNTPRSPVPVGQVPACSEATFQQPGPLVQMGVWSISYTWGFAVEDNLEKLVYLLETKNNPHAMWWPSAEVASYWARKDYIDRFIHFYDLRDIDILLPDYMLKPGMEYNDPRFEDGNMEISESTAMEKLREAGLL